MREEVNYLKFYNNYGLKDANFSIDQPLDYSDTSSTGFWRPLPLGYVAEKYGIVNPRTIALLAGWIASIALCIASVTYMVPQEWPALSPDKSTFTFFLVVYPPLIICNLLVIWFGFEWGFIPAYLSTFLVAYASGIPFYWSSLLGAGVILELAVFALVYYSVPISYDLRSISSFAFFVGVSFIASMAGSLGSFIWSRAHDLSILQTMIVWKGWWTGTFLQTVFIMAPILYLTGNRVEQFKSSYFEVPERPELSQYWIYGTIITVMVVLSVFIWATHLLGVLHIEGELTRFPNISRTNILRATESFRLTAWITITMVLAAGLGGIKLVSDWNESLKNKVTERVQQIRETERRFRATFEQAAVGFAHLQSDGSWLRVNDRLCSITGYSREELNLMDFKDLVHPEDRSLLDLPLTDVFTGQQDSINRDLRLYKKDGSQIWIQQTLSAVRDAQNIPEYFLTVIRDITSQKQAEFEIIREKNFTNSLLNSLPGIFYLFDQEGNLMRWNKNLEKVTGYNPKDLIYLDPLDLFPENQREFIRKKINEVFNEGGTSVEIPLVTKNGNELPHYFYGIKFATTKNQFLLGMGLDISEQKKFENRIQDSLKEKETLLAEIHHRVKNNLALISGLLELQMYSIEDGNAERVLKDSQSRIHSMALVHEQLYQLEQFSEIKLETYIRQLLKNIRETFHETEQTIDTHIESDAVYLTINQAIPFGLLINELLTNIYKHAFKDRNSGNINIELSKVASTVVLSVQDDGVGLPDDITLDQPETLGLTLINKLVEQLHATLQISRDNGTLYHIEFDIT